MGHTREKGRFISEHAMELHDHQANIRYMKRGDGETKKKAEDGKAIRLKSPLVGLPSS